MPAAACVVLLASGLLASFASALGSHRTQLISRATGTHGAKGNNSSRGASTSANGRFVAFSSDSSNLSSADPDSDTDVYVRDRKTNRTILASRANGIHGAGGDGASQDPRISANGRFVAFDSDSTNLSHSDTSNDDDVFVRDLKEHRTILVSRRSGVHGGKGNDFSFNPSVSGNGRFVAFGSDATNLSPADQVSDDDVYVRDLRRHRTVLASRAPGTHGAKGTNGSFDAAISANGRRVVFDSFATNLNSADTDPGDGIYVRDLKTKTTILASRRNGAHGANGDGESFEPSISATGRFVAFASGATNFSPADTTFINDIYVRDLRRHRTTLVSRASGKHGAHDNSADSLADSISGDGRLVAFESFSDKLVSADQSTDGDIYVRNLATHRTILVSRRNGTHGGKGTGGDSQDGWVSGFGNLVAFESQDTNLSPADSNTGWDIYVRTGPF